MTIKAVTIGDATLFHGDCAELVEVLAAADAVIADPPYEFDASGGGTFRYHRHAIDEVERLGLHQGFDIGIFDAIAAGGSVNSFATFFHFEQIYTIAAFFERSGFDKKALLAWQKTNPMPVANKHYVPELEYFWHGWRKPFGVQGNGVKSKKRIWQGPSGPKIDVGPSKHPTVKPLGLIEKLVANGSEPGALIADPFMGTGTTGVAALRMGRRFVGCEIDRAFFDFACRRIAYATDWREAVAYSERQLGIPDPPEFTGMPLFGGGE